MPIFGRSRPVNEDMVGQLENAYGRTGKSKSRDKIRKDGDLLRLAEGNIWDGETIELAADCDFQSGSLEWHYDSRMLVTSHRLLLGDYKRVLQVDYRSIMSVSSDRKLGYGDQVTVMTTGPNIYISKLPGGAAGLIANHLQRHSFQASR